LGGFSAAAHQLGLTPAAVSRNVALLEKNLSTRLFRRSTRKLTLTESGVRFLVGVRAHLDGLQSAITEVASDHGEPAGVVEVSVALAFGMEYLLPLLPDFMRRSSTAGGESPASRKARFRATSRSKPEHAPAHCLARRGGGITGDNWRGAPLWCRVVHYLVRKCLDHACDERHCKLTAQA
jgi:DNA-binding transcriptional LysR family regulator